MYNWQLKDWRNFEYNPSLFEEMALEFYDLAGQSNGKIETLTTEEQKESLLTILVKEALQTSAIEGEMISRVDLISSIKKNLGYQIPDKTIKDKRSVGIAQLLVQSREEYEKDLTTQILFGWHKTLMMGSLGIIHVGKWRAHTEPMQVVSGAFGREIVHFEAPPSLQVPEEMKLFIQWFNATKPQGKTPIRNPIVRSAIAHLYFETIHPFEDGNGRIGRVIAEKALSQNLKRPVLLSLSTTIEASRQQYYNALKQAQKSNHLNEWIAYFGKVILDAQKSFLELLTYSIKKTKFFDKVTKLLSEKQLKVIARMLEEGENSFVGGMSAKKYQAITKASKATATRDLTDMVQKHVLISKGGGRSTNYQVNIDLENL